MAWRNPSGSGAGGSRQWFPPEEAAESWPNLDGTPQAGGVPAAAGQRGEEAGASRGRHPREPPQNAPAKERARGAGEGEGSSTNDGGRPVPQTAEPRGIPKRPANTLVTDRTDSFPLLPAPAAPAAQQQQHPPKHASSITSMLGPYGRPPPRERQRPSRRPMDARDVHRAPGRSRNDNAPPSSAEQSASFRYQDADLRSIIKDGSSVGSVGRFDSVTGIQNVSIKDGRTQRSGTIGLSAAEFLEAREGAASMGTTGGTAAGRSEPTGGAGPQGPETRGSAITVHPG